MTAGPHLPDAGKLLCFAIGIMLTGLSCKKVIRVNLNNIPPQIVIEGEVTDLRGAYTVRVSQTVPYSVSNVFPPVTDATVIITDSTSGQRELLVEADSGVYKTGSITGQYLHTYQLLVVVDGKVYTASSTMPRPVKLDSITFEENIGLDGKQSINAIANFQDPPGVANYYQFKETVNGNALPDIFVFDDRLSDGKYIEDPLFNDSSDLQMGYSFSLTMNCVDLNVYNYLFELANVTASGNIQPTTPDNPVSNISNGAFGYFSAHTTSSQQVFIY